MRRPPNKFACGGHRKPLAIRLKEGTRVCVLLPKDASWFAGAVKKYDTKKALHTLVNEFGDAKRVDLRTVKWKLEGIDNCTDADIENALDRGGRWHKAQRAEFIYSMSSPPLSPRDVPSGKLGGSGGSGGPNSSWDNSRLRSRRESRDWYSSSDGESGDNEGMASANEDEDDFLDSRAETSGPPGLMAISRSAEDLENAFPHGHLDFELSVPGQALRGSSPPCSEEERVVGEKLGKPRGRKRQAPKVEATILKRPVGRPPKVRKGLAAIKYAQDIASRAICKMAQDKPCNFNLIPSSIPFVEELQLIFGISRRLKVDKQRLFACEGTEPQMAAEVLRGCRMAQEPASEPLSAPLSEPISDASEPVDSSWENQHQAQGPQVPAVAATTKLLATESQSSPMKPPCTITIREDWSKGFHSSLVV